MDKVAVFDTTLRDGEQSPGATLNIQEKIEIARQLEKLRVDIIEAGFPVTSPGDFDAVRIISQEVRRTSICALTDAKVQNIDRTWEALKDGVDPLLHIVLSSSDIHIQEMLRSSREQVLEWAVSVVRHARRLTSNIEFSPMDASRTEPAFLHRLLEAVIEAGASVVNIPDTVGFAYPQEFGDLISGIMENVPNIHRVRLSVHCHDDLGMAVANTLEALRRGARQFEGTINGIGERAGNASVEEIVMALRTRPSYFKLDTGVDTTQIFKTSRMVADLTGIAVPPNKAIVGANAFRHQSGLHQDGVLKDRATFEIIDAATIGAPSTSIVIGKHSGRHAFHSYIQEMGYELSEEEMARAFRRFKDLADKKKEVTQRDVESVLADELRMSDETYHLDHVQVTCGDHAIPTATVRLLAPDGEIKTDADCGTGPVDAVYRAINRIVGVPNKLIEFSVKSVTGGIDALGEVTIRIQEDGRVFTGRGADTDIVVASAKAYLNALNRLIASQEGASHKVRGKQDVTSGRR